MNAPDWDELDGMKLEKKHSHLIQRTTLQRAPESQLFGDIKNRIGHDRSDIALVLKSTHLRVDPLIPAPKNNPAAIPIFIHIS
jgi:hypothetical protein